MKKVSKKLIFLVSGIIIMLPKLIFADGMIAPPPQYQMYENSQQAVIFHERGVETLVISIKFRGDAEDFAWIVPTPSQPEVAKGSIDLFSNLNELTHPEIPMPLKKGGIEFFDASSDLGINVLEEKQVEYYDVTILAADDKNALFDWLNNNGYSYPKDKKYVLSSYVDNGWYFTAMKINTEAVSSDVSLALRTGQAVPVKFVFKTDKIVYPLKISSVFGRGNNLITKNSNASLAVSFTDPSETMPLNLNSSNFSPSGVPASVPDYTDGKFNKGVIINKDSVFSYPAQDAFFEKEGTIEMWINPKWWRSTRGGYWEFINVVDENKRDVFEFRRNKSSSNGKEGLQLVFYKPTGGNTIWKTEFNSITFQDNSWYHLAATWQENSEPQLYFNGQAQPLSTAYSGTGWEMKSADGGKIYVGQRGRMPGSYSARAVLDEVRISNRARTAEEIAASYNQSSALDIDSNTLFLAHFDDNLAVSDKDDNSAGTLAYSRARRSKITYPRNVTVTLYTVADHKKELSNFTTQYANWIKDKKIKDLAQDDQGNPWLVPENKKYYLTRLYASLNPKTQMTQDLFPGDAADNNPVNAPEETGGASSKTIFAILMIIGAALTLGVVFILIWQYQLKK